MPKLTFRLQPLAVALSCLMGCLDPYPAPVSQSDLNLLVVDGFINASDQSANVRLTAALPLDTVAVPEVIDDARVFIERNDGAIVHLTGTGKGNYVTSSATWDMNAEYRLNITLASGENYRSDFITLIHTPNIDSIIFREDKNALGFYVNTHEPSGNGRYYKWDYDETWEHTSSFVSFYKLIGGEAIERSIDERIYICWSSLPSANILIYNTLNLSDDLVSNFKLSSVPAGSERLSRRYSINVKQRTLSKAEYEFWSKLRETTEELGGLFDPMPYAVTGNIHGENNDNVVLGYFGGGEVKEQRIFVGLNDLPRNIANQTMRAPCLPDEIQSVPLANLRVMSPVTTILLEPIYVQGVGIVGYTFSHPSCADCRTQGGTTTIPDFW
ncbi:DUF4249 domain-containing protein [Chryseolinea sp. T2]|uniref:DUF4249 domain-containing protein n=1 Tax=Chryseolinea sp. T2 TaxID=3129255 RepID=UPI003078333B